MKSKLASPVAQPWDSGILTEVKKLGTSKACGTVMTSNPKRLNSQAGCKGKWMAEHGRQGMPE